MVLVIDGSEAGKIKFLLTNKSHRVTQPARRDGYSTLHYSCTLWKVFRDLLCTKS